MTGPFLASPQSADANGGWYSPPEHVRHAALTAELDVLLAAAEDES